MTTTQSAPAVILVVALAAIAPTISARPSQVTTRTVYASAVDRDERHVLGLTAADFVVREGGQMQRISVRPGTAPLRVALIVSDGGSGVFQGAAIAFCEGIVDHAEIAIIGMVVDFERLTDYTQNIDRLREGLLRLGTTGFISAPTNPHLIEAIVDVTKDIRREGFRPAIVVLHSRGESDPAFSVDAALNALRRSGAIMYVVGSAGRPRSSVVLDGGARESGGYHVDVGPTTIMPRVRQIASDLLNQYEITYTPSAGIAPDGRISVSSTRKDVTVRAPSRVAR